MIVAITSALGLLWSKLDDTEKESKEVNSGIFEYLTNRIEKLEDDCLDKDKNNRPSPRRPRIPTLEEESSVRELESEPVRKVRYVDFVQQVKSRGKVDVKELLED